MSFSVSFAMPGPAYEGMGASDCRRRRWFYALCGLGGLGFAAPGRRRGSRSEVRRARDRPVEARPALALAQRLLDPVERAEPAAEVVDHVHERRLARARDHRRAVLELPVVRQDDVEKCLRGVRREARYLLDLAPHQVVTERYLAEQLPRVRESDRAA